VLLRNDKLDDVERGLEQSADEMNAVPALGESLNPFFNCVLTFKDGAELDIFTALLPRVRSSMGLAATQTFVQMALIQQALLVRKSEVFRMVKLFIGVTATATLH
jgi:hypothetical protein